MTSSTLLINEPPLQVLPTLAKRIGLNEAIVLQQIHYWIHDKRNKNIIDDCRWVYNSYEQWQEQFPFWCKNTIINIMKKLKDKDIILIKNIGPANCMIKYYSINYQSLNLLLHDTTETLVSGYQDLVPGIYKEQAGYQDLVPVHQDLVPVHQDLVPDIYKERVRVSETTQRLHRDSMGAHSRNVPPHPLSFFSISDQEEKEDSFSVAEIISNHDKQTEHKTKSRKQSKAQRATRLSEDWELPDEWRDWALQAGMFNEQIGLQAEKFKLYWLSTAKNPTKINWFMTWKRWCYDNLERSGNPIKIPQSSLSQQVQTSAIPQHLLSAIHPKSENFVNKFRELISMSEFVSWEKFADSEMKLVIDDKYNNKIRIWVKDQTHSMAIGQDEQEFLLAALKGVAPEIVEKDPSLNNWDLNDPNFANWISITTEDNWNWQRRSNKGWK